MCQHCLFEICIRLVYTQPFLNPEAVRQIQETGDVRVEDLQVARVALGHHPLRLAIEVIQRLTEATARVGGYGDEQCRVSIGAGVSTAEACCPDAMNHVKILYHSRDLVKCKNSL